MNGDGAIREILKEGKIVASHAYLLQIKDEMKVCKIETFVKPQTRYQDQVYLRGALDLSTIQAVRGPSCQSIYCLLQISTKRMKRKLQANFIRLRITYDIQLRTNPVAAN